MRKKVKLFESFEKSIILIIVCTVVVTACAVFVLQYVQNNTRTIKTLESQAEVIYEYASETISAESFFVLNTEADMDTSLYKDIQSNLNEIRKIGHLKYLYTIKQNEAGEYIYLVDGQPANTPDFCPLGLVIEDDLVKDVQSVLDGNIVFADKIRDTGYGPVHITYWPYYDNTGDVIGVIGMEYDAAVLNKNNQNAVFFSIVVALAIIAVLSVLATIVFKGVFAPFHKKLAYTDVLTGLDNRTAFEMDLRRLQYEIRDHEKIVFIVFDLNNLKMVNDMLGHGAGDDYLKKGAQIIHKHFDCVGQCYRIGGDEFCVIAETSDDTALRDILENDFTQDMISEKKYICDGEKGYFAIAYGMAVYDKEKLLSFKKKRDKGDDEDEGGCEGATRDLHGAFSLADSRMYEKKRKMKEEEQ